MGKKKKTTEKLLSFYRGPKRKSVKIADQDEIKIIKEALLDCLQFDKRQCSYSFNWSVAANSQQEIKFKIIAGLSAGLRCIKQKRTLALIFDDKVHLQLIKYLTEFAEKLNIPIIQVTGLSEIVSELKLRSLSLVSFVKDVMGDEEIYQKPGHIKPKATIYQKMPDSLESLCKLFQELSKNDKNTCTTLFKLPLIERITSSGKSKAKKEAKRKSKEIKSGD